jgi:saccharopine dehydrogenase (NAD+, L-lysine-forming)
MTIKSIFLRKEVYPNEFRCPIVPNDVKILKANGFDVIIQSSELRCFSDSEFEQAGATITDKHWVYFPNSLIIGLKELDNIEKLNSHTHIYFSHTFKNQSGSKIILDFFTKSKSNLYDLEYFVDSKGKRLLAFGFYAGFIGAGLGLLQYGKKFIGEKLTGLNYWKSSQNLISQIQNYNFPLNFKICIIGSNGRCGSGAKALLDKIGLKYFELHSQDIKLNLESYDLVINCINLTKDIGTWYDSSTEFNKHTVIVDVSCDYTNLNNPIKIYNKKTTWEEPVFKYNEFVDIIAIDNLPSLLPYESSTEFSSLLTNLLTQYEQDQNKYWENNLQTFKKIINFV